MNFNSKRSLQYFNNSQTKMSEKEDIFEFDIDVFEQSVAEPCKSPVREEMQQQIIPQNKIKVSSKEQQPEINQQKNQKQRGKKIYNKFSLTDEQKINISKRLPKGFVLIKKGDSMQNFTPFKGEIEYVPIKKPPKIASQELLLKFPLSVLSTMNPKKDIQKRVQKPGLRLSSGQLPEGKSKQTQKVKGVLLKFRKHPRYPQLSQQLNKLGLMQGFTEIESQIKKSIHTIDSFKDRCLYILNQAKLATSSETTTEVINELIDQFMFQIEQAKKLQFQNNLQSIQKNIDKITREITDIRESGNWYIRKKKRTEKSFDEKQVMYIADLVRALPPAYLVGVWEIIQEKSFLQSQQKQIQINFSQLKTKKIRQIESYVKRKHNTYATSRERKKQKLRRKQQEEGYIDEIKEQQEGEMVKEQQEIGQVQKKEIIKIQHTSVLKEAKKDKKIQDRDIFAGIVSEQQNELQSLLSVEDIQKPHNQVNKLSKREQGQMEHEGIFGMSGQDMRKESKMMVDDFLQLDDMLSPQIGRLGRIESNTQVQDVKIPQTPRFSTLENNQQLEQYDVRREKLRLSNQGEIVQEKQVEQFQMQKPDLRIPQPIDNDSSDSSFITDDEDSDY